MKVLLSGGLALAGGGIVQALVGFATQLVLMRLLEPGDFGAFFMVFAGCSLAQTVLSLRLNVLIIRAPEAALAQREDQYMAALLWETVVAALATAAWLAILDLNSPLALLLVLAMAVGQWTNQVVSFYERGMPYSNIAAVETGAQLAGSALSVIVALAGCGTVSLYVREAASAMVRLVAFCRLGALRRPRFALPSWGQWRELVREAWDVWTEGIVEGGFSRVVVLAGGLVGGLEGAGVFAQAQRLAMVPHQVLAPVTNRLAANMFSRITAFTPRRRLLWRLVGISLSVLAIGAATVILLADPVVPWLFGAHWADAAPVLVCMAGVVLFTSPFELMRAYCLSQCRAGLVLAARALQYCVYGAAVAWALSGGGIEGLGLGLSAATAVGFAVIVVGLLAKAPPQAG